MRNLFVVQGSTVARMLAARRKFMIGQEEISTPILLPSYSSRASDQSVSKVIAVTKEFVSGPILVSAYDICREKLNPSSLSFATHIFLDSGGYEARDETDLSEVAAKPRVPKPWTIREYEGILEAWDFGRPTVVVSYDVPTRREGIKDQLKRAHRYREKYAEAAHLLLVKPEPNNDLVNVDWICKNAKRFSDFDIVGVTEKELGHSTLKRLVAVANIRRALDRAALQKPIHIFGSLDPIACPLFFLAGADIFDGLTWLRYAYVNGLAIYRQNAPALDPNLHDQIKDGELSAMVQIRNYQQLGRLGDQMVAYLQKRDFHEFGAHEEYFRRMSQRVIAEMGG
jgi:hypothetical protein